ncbi:MAG: hypothetical protein EP344_13685 [Bacteroidetes bacterium]|nr:MAG: hypothetical protein EP344_13685 [Bacteroidota bacterium]
MNTIKGVYIVYLKWVLLLLVAGLTGTLQAQEEEADEPEKADAIMELRFKEANNTAKFLTAIVKAEVDEFYQPMEGVEVRFYRKEAAPENLIGSSKTNAKGAAICDLEEDEATFFGADPDFVYLATIENSDTYNDLEEMITVAESDFSMDLQTEDDTRQILISLQGIDENGEQVPVADAEVGIYVTRLFGLLRVSEDMEFTDEDGSLLIDFPADIPGDENGMVTIVAKVDEHERYGFLELRKKIDWGVPVVIDQSMYERELWSSRANAPWYLIVIVNAVLIGIWGSILYIIYEVAQIKKIGRQAQKA